MTQAEKIELALIKLLDNENTDLDIIYSEIVSSLKVPRPTVRRVARDYRMKLQKHCAVLSANCEIQHG